MRCLIHVVQKGIFKVPQSPTFKDKEINIIPKFDIIHALCFCEQYLSITLINAKVKLSKKYLMRYNHKLN